MLEIGLIIYLFCFGGALTAGAMPFVRKMGEGKNVCVTLARHAAMLSFASSPSELRPSWVAAPSEVAPLELKLSWVAAPSELAPAKLWPWGIPVVW